MMPLPEPRLSALEQRQDEQARTLEMLAPVAVRIAEISVRQAEHTARFDRIDRRLDPLRTRLRRVEYAIVALVVAVGSPKLGVPSVPEVASAAASLFT